MKTKILFVPVLFAVFVALVFMPGCAPQQHASRSKHVSEAEYQQYVQKYPQMGEKVKQGILTKDAAYSLRNIAPQMQIMNQSEADLAARAAEIDKMHVSEAEKRRLITEYMRQNQQKYVDAANEAGKEAQSQNKN